MRCEIHLIMKIAKFKPNLKSPKLLIITECQYANEVDLKTDQQQQNY